MPSNSDYGQKRQSIKRNRKRPQSAKNRRTKSYTVSRLYQNFGSLRVSKIPFKEQTARQNKSKNKTNSNVASKEKEFNGGISKEDIGSWCPRKATVEHVKGFYSKTKAVNTNIKQISPACRQLFSIMCQRRILQISISASKENPVSQARTDGFNGNNVNEKRLGILHQLFRYAVLNENICTGKFPTLQRL